MAPLSWSSCCKGRCAYAFTCVSHTPAHAHHARIVCKCTYASRRHRTQMRMGISHARQAHAQIRHAHTHVLSHPHRAHIAHASRASRTDPRTYPTRTAHASA
eukprot:1078648-Pleurochrysis_carterae.AAC.2